VAPVISRIRPSFTVVEIGGWRVVSRLELVLVQFRMARRRLDPLAQSKNISRAHQGCPLSSHANAITSPNAAPAPRKPAVSARRSLFLFTPTPTRSKTKRISKISQTYN